MWYYWIYCLIMLNEVGITNFFNLYKYRFWNKYIALNSIILMMILLFSYFMYNENLQTLLKDIFVRPDDIHPDAHRGFIILSLKSILTWEYFVSFSMFNMALIFPLFSVLPCIPFTTELRSYFLYGKHRFTNIRKHYWFTIIQYASIATITVTMSMAFIFTLAGFFMIPTLSTLGSIDSWLPEGTYTKYPYVVFMFMLFFYYGPMIFAYALLTLGCALWTQRVYVLPICVYIIFIVQTRIAVYFNLPYLNIERNIIAYNIGIPLWQMYVSILVVAVIAIIIIYFGINKASKEHKV